MLALFLGSLVAAILVFGWRIFGEPSTPSSPDGDLRPEHAGPLTVAHLQDRMVHLYGETATYWESPDGEEEWAVRVSDCLFAELEVSRGEWLEFVEACRADPAAVPLFLRDLWRPDVAIEPEQDTEEQHVVRGFSNQYIDAWWDRVQTHHREAFGHDVERPPDLEAPLPESYGTLLLVPPTWIRIGSFEEFEAALPEGTARMPVTDISWYDAVAFAEWASGVLDMELRLPTVMEWMRAGNGGDPELRYPWGNPDSGQERLPRYACNSTLFWGLTDKSQLLPVDYRFSDGDPTAEGVQQMAGNAREWLRNHELDPRDGYYGTLVSETVLVPVPDPSAPQGIRLVPQVSAKAPTIGGSFRDAIEDCTVDMSSLRNKSKFGRWDDVGFRLWAPSNWMGK